jgi:putative Mg2+ transporter-C (MgtC) family protein
METWIEASGWALPETLDTVRFCSRLLSAVVLGGIVGIEREFHGTEAGLRTHILVALGAALFTFVPLHLGGENEIGGVVRGLAPGIGFIGAGAILKLTDKREIWGLTTAASVWLTAAIGFAVGASYMWPALLSVLVSVFVLWVLGRFERAMAKRNEVQARTKAVQGERS